jgi:PTS system ascorbate-specific IIA component
MPGFALAHAEPSADVYKTEMALAVFDEDIDFHSFNGPVRLIVVLACKDKTSHLERLATMASKMMDDMTLIDHIIQSNSIEEISCLINE